MKYCTVWGTVDFPIRVPQRECLSCGASKYRFGGFEDASSLWSYINSHFLCFGRNSGSVVNSIAMWDVEISMKHVYEPASVLYLVKF